MADDIVRHRLSWKVAGSSTAMGVRPGCGAKRKYGAARLTATTRSDEELRTTETDDESGTPSLSTATRQTISPSSFARRMASGYQGRMHRVTAGGSIGWPARVHAPVMRQTFDGAGVPADRGMASRLTDVPIVAQPMLRQ